MIIILIYYSYVRQQMMISDTSGAQCAIRKQGQFNLPKGFYVTNTMYAKHHYVHYEYF